MNQIKKLIIFIGCVFSAVLPQKNNKDLTVEWIHSEEAKSISKVSQHVWLKNNTAILYDNRIPIAERDFKVLDPEKPDVLTSLLDNKKAVGNLNQILGDSLTGLDWPVSFDSNGQKAIYIFNGDIFILETKTSSFRQITNSIQEEKSVRFSPDGQHIAYVRENNLFTYSFLTNRETILTKTGSETLLNGTLSWVYWEEIFGRQDIGFWWSHDSKHIAFLETDESMVTKMHYVDFKPCLLYTSDAADD